MQSKIQTKRGIAIFFDNKKYMTENVGKNPSIIFWYRPKVPDFIKIFKVASDI